MKLGNTVDLYSRLEKEMQNVELKQSAVEFYFSENIIFVQETSRNVSN